MAPSSLGLILPNRAVVLGAVTVRDLIDLSVEAEGAGVFDTVWVGDSLLAKPRLESVTLLSTLAGATSRLRLAVGCMATFVHRHPVMLAHQWASLDVLSGGRAWLAVCLGGPNEAGAAQALEHAAMGIQASERVGRLEEGIAVLRKLFAGTKVSHHGRFYQFEGVTVEPRPVQQPCPIWIASNPTGLTWKGGASASDAAVERSFRRVARYADGWVTNKLSPEEFRGPGSGMRASLEDVLALGRELLSPRLVAPETRDEMTSVQFPGLSGVLPDHGRFDPLDWGLGVQLNTEPRTWMGSRTSARTFGHFGGTGTFLWVDPEARVVCAALTGRNFGDWAKGVWPPFADAVIAELA